MLFTVIKKEAKQLLSDKGFLIISLIQPIIFIIMFGSSFQGGDINHLDTIVINEDNGRFSEYVTSAVENSDFFEVINFSGSFKEAMKKINKSEVRALIFIKKGFSENIDNVEAGEIEVYLDSSNFLVFNSLSAAKIEIAKNSLLNITNDILKELEQEKNEKEKTFKGIKVIYDKIEIEMDLLEIYMKELKEDMNNGNISKFERSLKELKDGINDSKNSLIEVQNAFDGITLTLNSMVMTNTTNIIKRAIILESISNMSFQFNGTIDETQSLIKELDSIKFPETNSILEKKIESSFDKILNFSKDMKEKSDKVNFEFKKLKRSFLSEPLKLKNTATYGPLKYFDYLGAGVLSLIVFFVGIMAPALNIISEKEKNTLYRVSTTPISNFTFFVGKFLIFACFVFLEMIYTLILAIWLYDLRIEGSIYSVIFILFLLTCASISIGLWISSKIKSMQQALVIVPLIVIPSFLISHAFFPADIMPDFMNYIAYITPMTFSNHALNAIMIKGFSLNQVMPDILALLGFLFIPLILFIQSFKKIKY